MRNIRGLHLSDISLWTCYRHCLESLYLSWFWAHGGGNGLIDRKVYFRYPKKIFIGKRCAINRGCRFFASAHTDDKRNIVIGDHVVIGPNVTIFSAGHDPLTIELDDTYGRVTIEDDVWIGGNVTILQGVTIHEGAVIGAGSVVVKDMPAWSICVGNPAKVVKDRKIREEYDEVQEDGHG